MNLEKQLYFETLKREIKMSGDIEKMRQVALQSIELYMLQQEALKEMVEAFGGLANL